MRDVRRRVPGKLTVKARSSVHDTTTVWDKITGDVDADPDAIEQAQGDVHRRHDVVRRRRLAQESKAPQGLRHGRATRRATFTLDARV